MIDNDSSCFDIDKYSTYNMCVLVFCAKKEIQLIFSYSISKEYTSVFDNWKMLWILSNKTNVKCVFTVAAMHDLVNRYGVSVSQMTRDMFHLS